MINKFVKFLENNLPNGCYPAKEHDRVSIYRNGAYIYMFYNYEIENEFSICCDLIQTILEVVEE